mmetsp:Transcript_63532/g.113040  ORF Transcript_63532/g.113040 Transcript_63532/m.113040 type:complete len:161 (+) Transcript_63532:60-542(+)|eukprot:CAMPEP_0197659384 /NCGR_PEP_ID=MMETSP1338-20131121/47466_1 /TAXON_ID=43686 ORGANISM="Pelagodinium beii, Strain RCC1491" /NCGR_SAMPLE_ID=MMETSP1338 /ASSEMBLY_ACC=CAM_ASM_000754 /LENGTH=160 /DNA_ID=CAMNT_0043236285 /DNA_START=58 /DNA_END=540 /DNA_ORIENTATION=+
MALPTAPPAPIFRPIEASVDMDDLDMGFMLPAPALDLSTQLETSIALEQSEPGEHFGPCLTAALYALQSDRAHEDVLKFASVHDIDEEMQPAVEESFLGTCNSSFDWAKLGGYKPFFSDKPRLSSDCSTCASVSEFDLSIETSKHSFDSPSHSPMSALGQ